MSEQSTEKHDEVSIIVDKKEVKSPNPTTGSALYILGPVKQGYDLLQEVPGQGDDLLIPNDNTVVNLKHGEHFYSSKSKLNPGI